MKRTRSINLDRMRKGAKQFALKPTAIAVALATLTACGQSREATVYRDAEHCINNNPGLQNECHTAYQQALAKAATSGPKYRTVSSCEGDFGRDNCVPYRPPSGQNWFMPALGGFLLARATERDHYQSAPVYTSYSRYSPAYGRWTTVDGDLYGVRRYGKVNVKDSAFKPKPAVTRTISRGGFGSTISAKSSWGGSSRSGWGG